MVKVNGRIKLSNHEFVVAAAMYIPAVGSPVYRMLYFDCILENIKLMM